MISRETILKRHWMVAIRNRAATFSPDDIERDKRSLNKSIREVVKMGWLKLMPTETAAEHREYYAATEELLNSVPGTKPDLARHSELSSPHRFSGRYEAEKFKGPALERLSISELRYVAEHPADYTWFDQWERPVDRDTYFGSTYLQDEDLRAAQRAVVLAMNIAEASGKNLAWGLKTAGMIEDVDADIFQTSDPGNSFGHRNPHFGNKPEKWGEDAERMIKELRERIARDTRHVNALVRADSNVHGHGGWDKFVEEYKDRLDKAVTAREAKKAS